MDDFEARDTRRLRREGATAPPRGFNVHEVVRSVREFHRAFGQPVRSTPGFPAADRRELRMKLLREEVDELAVAEDENDLVGVADALGDVAYIVGGTAVEYGIPLGDVFDEIHRSNMAKLGADGIPILRADGKILKPEGWKPPNIADAIFYLSPRPNYATPWDQEPETAADGASPYSGFDRFTQWMSLRDDDVGWWDSLDEIDRGRVYGLLSECARYAAARARS